MMKLYNTLTRNIEDITPLNPPIVSVYTCGPTVYDYPHIGNWFTFVRYDLLVRTLKASGLEPKWVMNITDVGHLVSDGDEGEDKLEKGARREGKTAWDIAAFYGDYFLAGLERLNITKPNFLPKATEHIEEQIELIKQLEAKAYTYQISDGIYYDTSTFEGYEAFARLDLDDQQASGRLEPNPEKRSPSDFALWKFSPEDHKRDMEWDSPWGRGFPGWHLECSAMSMKYLGETLDVHAGGIDHIPVHHTNEIAQSEAVTGKRFANYWMHANHISANGEKISKSLGNGITLEDIEAKGFDLMTLRLHILESHYRSQSKFSWESLAAAQSRLRHWRAVAALQHQGRKTTEGEDPSAEFKTTVLAALADDLNTPKALQYIDEVFTHIESHPLNDINSADLRRTMEFVDSLLGLNLAGEPDISAAQKQLLQNRQTARDEQDWAASDALRDQLTAQGVGVRDSALGAIWFRL
jgi:cysteinyl-tRNA synthetase